MFKNKRDELVLVNYIQVSLNKGFSKDAVKKVLLKKGWDKDGSVKDTNLPSNLALPPTLIFTNDLASYTWTAKWFDDNNDPTNNYPDYQFEASILGTPAKVTSNILEVKSTPYNNENTCTDLNPNAKCEQQCTSQGLECVEQLGSVLDCNNCCLCGLTQDFEDGSSATKIYGDCVEDTDTEDQYGTVNVETTIKDKNGNVISQTTETEQCTLLKDVPVPFFNLINLLIVVVLIAVYYVLKRKKYI